MAQSAGLRIGAFDDKAEFQEAEPTALEPTLASAYRIWLCRAGMHSKLKYVYENGAGLVRQKRVDKVIYRISTDRVPNMA